MSKLIPKILVFNSIIIPEAEAVQSPDNKPEIAEEFVVLIAKKKLLMEDKLLLQMFWEAVEEIDALVDKAKDDPI